MSKMPLSSFDLPRKLTSTALGLLLITSFVTMILPVPMIYSDNAFGEFATSEAADLLANSLAKMEGLELESGLPFIQNEGQVHPDVQFYIDTFAGRVYVTDHGLTYSLKSAESKVGIVIKESFFQSNPLRPYGTEQSRAVVNYYTGEKDNWRSNVATFDKVSLGEVWNGIGVQLNAAGNNVEKIFTVAPGANVGDIQVTAEGVTALSVDSQGQLVMVTEHGEVALTKPLAFQEINGQTVSVEVSYVVGQNNRYGFTLGSNYNPNFALVIDPLLASTYLGGTLDEGVSPSTLNPTEGAEIAFDSGGNVYIAGLTLSDDYPTTTTFLPDPNLNSDVVVSKLSGDLTQLLASTYIAGNHLDETVDIAIDSSGDVYVTGRTNSTNYPTTGGALDEVLNNGTNIDLFDAFVSKLDSNLVLVGSTYLGGSDQDEASDIVISAAGNVYVTGHTFSADYPTVAGSYDTSFNAPGQSQGFVTALLGDLSGLHRSTFIGGSNDSRMNAIAISAAGEIYVAGFTLAQDFPIVGGYQATKSNQNQHDTVVAIFDSTLTSLIRSTYHGAGTTAGEHTTPFGIAVTAAEKVYVAGLTQSPTFPTTPGSYDTTFGGGPRDAYISVLPKTLDSLLSSTFIGGTANEIATGLALSGTSVYVTISGGGVSYPTTPGAFDEGSNDAYISKFSLDLGSLEASTSFGGSNTDVLTAIDINADGDVVILGHTRSTDFPVTSGAYDLTKAGVAGAFDFTVSKLTADLAAAASYEIQSNNANGDCEAIGGTWSAPTCTLSTSFTLNSGDSLLVNSGAILAVTSTGSIDNAGSITNDGTLNIFPAGIIVNTGTVTNTATIGSCSNPGVIDSALSGIVNTGMICSAIRIPDGTTFSSDYTVTFPILVALGRTMTIDPGVTFTITSASNSRLTITNTGSTVNNGGIIDNAGSLTIFTGSVLVNTGTINNSGTIGSSTNPGIIDSALSGIINTGIIHAHVLLPDDTVFSSDYTVTFPLRVANGRTMTIDPGVTFTITSASNSRLTITNTGSTVNNGGIIDNAGGIDIFTGAKIVNTGTINNSGTIGSSTNPGTIENDCGGTINNTGTIHVSVVDTCTEIPTNLFLDPISDVTATTGFTVSGTLSNANTGEPITGKLITFTGSGLTPSLQAVTTDGVDFIGDIDLVSCPTPANPGAGDCVPDELSTLDADGTDNIVLHLGVGGKIIFPEGTIGAKLWIQNMGDTPFKYVVQEGNGVIQTEAESGGSESIVPIVNIISGYSDVGGDFVQNGLEEITITEVDGSSTFGSVGIAAILTTNPDGLPAEQHQINFEEFAAGTLTSPFTVNAGHFFSVGFAQNVESDGPLGVTAHFAGDVSFAGDDSNTEEYIVIHNTRGTQGEGAQVTSNSLGGSITTGSCVTDADNDGICQSWEVNGLISGVPNIAGGYAIPITSDSRKDIYVEIDCMLQSDGVADYCPSGTDLTAVTTAFARENIDLHITLTGVDKTPFKNPFHIWTDADGDSRNDFANIKLDFFGTATERSQGTAGTLRSGKDLLELKAQIYHYGVFVKNINTGTTTTCGPSGQAELYGNDFIVSLGCGFAGAKGSVQEIQGTLMHELGHNLGLKHGGLDDDNCKPNHISVMNYARQLPWAQLGATNSGTTVNWALTYSREDLDNLSRLDENSVQENAGLSVTPGQWSNTLPSGYQFKLIWGLPPSVLTGVTGASVNWDNDANLAESVAFAQDLNKITGMAGCAPGTTILGALESYDEFANLDLRFRDGANMDGLVYPDPDTVSELTPEVLEGVTSTILTLEPIADVTAGGQITATGVLTDLSGNPLANELITFSGSGAENLLSDTTNSTGWYTSSGNAPATVGTEWEVEAHFAGTEDDGPAFSDVELYDTLDGDNNPPTVVNTAPADGDTEVGLDVIISAEFSEAMNDATITTSTFTLEGPSGPITGTVGYDPDTKTATFDPASDLAQSTEYAAKISSTVEDSAGNLMGADYVWSFTTGSAALTILGFYSPTDMEDGDGNPIVNTIKAGRSVPLKFEVFDNSNVEQTSTSIVESFKAQKINCATLQGEPVDPIEVTNTGGTGLRYDTEQGLFVQNWKTPSQAGSCYQVTLATTDGSSISAYFRLLQ